MTDRNAHRSRRRSLAAHAHATAPRPLRLEPLEDRRLLATDFQLLADINQLPASSSPGFFTPVGDIVFFTATDFQHGRELWATDGTTAGTRMVKDILPGEDGSTPLYLTNVDGTLFFAARTSYGTELWKSDGTDVGTVRVKDVTLSGGGPNNPFALTNFAGELYFVATEVGYGYELWKSDGTPEGTERVKDIAPEGDGIIESTSDGAPGSPHLTAVGSTLFFIASQRGGATGRELWKTDGTEAGTVMVKDIRPGPDVGGFDLGFDGGAYPMMTNVNGTVYFVADDGTSGAELWKSDGTAEGTAIVKDITPGNASTFGRVANTPTSSRHHFANLGDTLYFGFAGSNLQIWRSDGTSDGTDTIYSLARTGWSGTPPIDMTIINDQLYFAHWSAAEGVELWTSDGTPSGTALLKDIHPAGSSNPSRLTNVNGTLYFSANDGGHGEELWRSDGTAAGTEMVRDVAPGIASSSPSGMTQIGNQFLFRADDATSGIELWSSDGTLPGTALLAEIRTGTLNSRLQDFVELNGILYFTEGVGLTRSLWRTDGTSEGTWRFTDLRIPSAYANRLVRMGDHLYFGGGAGSDDTELWRTDGTLGGTVLVRNINSSSSSLPENFAVVNGILYFRASDGNSGRELWRSDGTRNGTYRVKDIVPGSGSSDVQKLINVDGLLYFEATTSATGAELWRSDGTDAGTWLVNDIRPGSISSFIDEMIEVSGRLYFTADDGPHGEELWRSESSPDGARMFADLYDGFLDGRPTWLTNVGGTLYFAANSRGNLRLWKVSPASMAPEPVQRDEPGTFFNSPSYLTNVDGLLYFSALDGPQGRRLYRTDGTLEGTWLVSDISPSSSGSANPDALNGIDGVLYFSAFTNDRGRELWASDGTPEGTKFVTDLTGDASSSSPTNFMKLGDRLVFVATTQESGMELWSAKLAPSRAGDYNLDRHLDGTDFLAWQRAVGTLVHPAGSGADGDGSGIVDAGDLAVWVAQWETIPETESAAAAAADREFPSAPPTADQDPAAIADALFAAGDFTSLFNSAPDPLRPRSYRPPRRG